MCMCFFARVYEEKKKIENCQTLFKRTKSKAFFAPFAITFFTSFSCIYQVITTLYSGSMDFEEPSTLF